MRGTARTTVLSIAGVNPGGANDPAYLATGPIDLTPYLSPNTAIRIHDRSGEDLGVARFFYVDDVEITGTIRTQTAGPGGAPPNLASGYDLLPGESMTVVFDVTVDDPPTVSSVDNTASVTSDQQATPTSDITSDTVQNRPPVLDPVEGRYRKHDPREASAANAAVAKLKPVILSDADLREVLFNGVAVRGEAAWLEGTAQGFDEFPPSNRVIRDSGILAR